MKTCECGAMNYDHSLKCWSCKNPLGPEKEKEKEPKWVTDYWNQIPKEWRKNNCCPG